MTDSRARRSPLSVFAPDVAAWFRAAFGQPTPIQARAWPEIAAGASALLCAPTGSGKTLAAFLYAIDRLRRRPAAPAAAGVRVVYVSPLRALGNDVRRNLEVPLAALGGPRAGVRTGDTAPGERRRQLRQPPEILITTPESLFILLAGQAGRQALAGVETVIVDEIHAVAGEKRGAHLALTLERLEALCGRPLQRIGLSATQRPLAEMGAFLSGGRPIRIIDASAPRSLDLRVESPVEDFGDIPGDSIWDSIAPRVLELIRSHRSTLVFVGNRTVCERLTAKINAAAGEEICRSHHGSTARHLREAVEAGLKAGRLRAVCATGTLEFGIDIGEVDLVVQVEAPHGVARGLQRVGRAGHQVGGTPRGRILAKHPGDLLEAAVTARAMRAGAIEPTRIPTAPIDVLAQQAIATVAAAGEPLAVADLLALVRRAHPYRDLSREGLGAALRLVSDASLGPPRLDWDRAGGTLRARPGARLLAVRAGGTIPDRGLFPAIHQGRQVGELDEEFVYESRVGDTFVLGSTSWRIEAIQAGRVQVSPGRGGLPRVPFWHGEGLGRPAELGRTIGAFLREAEGRVREGDAEGWLARDYDCGPAAARALARHLSSQPVLPNDRRLVAEMLPDPLGEGLYLIHCVYGARVNAPWAIALGAALGTQAVYTDDGVLLRLPAARAAGVARRFDAPTLRRHLLAALPRSPLFAALFRENAARALVLPRLGPGRRTPLWLQRLRAGDALVDALRVPDHPLVAETLRQCLEDVFDLPAWEGLLAAAEVVELPRGAPTPFARGLLMQFQAKFLYAGDAPSAEREQADLAAGARLPEAEDLAAAAARARGRAVDADGLADLLRRTGGLTDAELVELAPGLSPADLGGRARREGALWVATDEGPPGPDRVARLLRTSAPVTVAEVAARLELPDAGPILAQLTAQGRAVSVGGRFAAPEVLRAASREAEARLRREIRPRSRGAHAAWVDRRLRGDLEHVLDGLQGYALSPAAWETEVLPRRVPGYRPDLLDRLLAGGAFIAVGRRPAFLRRELAERLLGPAGGAERAGGAEGREGGKGAEAAAAADGATGTDGGEAVAAAEGADAGDGPEGAASAAFAPVAAALAERGALFFSDVCRFSGLAADQALPELLRLLDAGEVTNDSFAPWRLPRDVGPGRAGAGLHGRWSLVPRRGRGGAGGAAGGGVDGAAGGTARDRVNGAAGGAVRDRVNGAAAGAVRDRVDGTAGGVAGGRAGGATGNPRATTASASALSGAPSRFAGRRGAAAHPRSPDAAAWTQVLLDRYGVLARSVWDRETPPVPWSEGLAILRARAAAGQLLRGYFVRGLGGLQFALPEAIEGLRAEKAAPWWWLPACDPANLLPGEPARREGAFLVLGGERPALAVVGGRVRELRQLSDADRTGAAGCLAGLPAPRGRLALAWPEGGSALAAAGFRSTPRGWVLHRTEV